jgi:hypothetical protein
MCLPLPGSLSVCLVPFGRVWSLWCPLTAEGPLDRLSPFGLVWSLFLGSPQVGWWFNTPLLLPTQSVMCCTLLGQVVCLPVNPKLDLLLFPPFVCFGLPVRSQGRRCSTLAVQTVPQSGLGPSPRQTDEYYTAFLVAAFTLRFAVVVPSNLTCCRLGSSHRVGNSLRACCCCLSLRVPNPGCRTCETLCLSGGMHASLLPKLPCCDTVRSKGDTLLAC